jgi:uncharacterized protein (DUF1697 family)
MLARDDMSVIISMLRSVNLASHNRLKMDDLRAFYESLGFTAVQTYIQSGNVVFKSKSQDLTRLSRRIEDELERRFSFRTDVILRTPSDLKDILARNPFAKRPGLEPGKLLVDFLVREPSAEALEKASKLKAAPEELRIVGRELYMYFPNGMGRPKISWGAVEKVLNTPGTGRNLNTVRNLLEIALEMESR